MVRIKLQIEDDILAKKIHLHNNYFILLKQVEECLRDNNNHLIKNSFIMWRTKTITHRLKNYLLIYRMLNLRLST